MAMLLILVVHLLPVTGDVPSSGRTMFTLTITEYRVNDADSALLAAYDLPKERMLEAFTRIEPRLAWTVSGATGQVVRVEHEQVSGTVRVDEAGGEKLRVTLELERFFKGTPLLIDRCEPHVVVRTRARLQNRTQLTVRAIEVRGQICSADLNSGVTAPAS